MQELIVDYMNNFYGYGNLDSRLWLIGMEEGCGDDWETEVLPRFVHWQASGRKKTEDLRGYHFGIGIRHHWEQAGKRPIRVQFTWRRLIETILCSQRGPGHEIVRADIGKYQSQSLGNAGGENCLLELLPLPSPNLAEFAYRHLANEDYPFFRTRSAYRAHIMGTRIQHIRDMMETHRPSHVVLYGKTYLPEWTALVANAPWEDVNAFIQRCRVFGTHVWCVPHPRARNIPADLFQTLGHMIWATDNGIAAP